MPILASKSHVTQVTVPGGGGATVATPAVGAPATEVTPIVVTGSKGANAALTSLIAALVNLGLVTDQTT